MSDDNDFCDGDCDCSLDSDFFDQYETIFNSSCNTFLHTDLIDRQQSVPPPPPLEPKPPDIKPTESTPYTIYGVNNPSVNNSIIDPINFSTSTDKNIFNSNPQQFEIDPSFQCQYFLNSRPCLSRPENDSNCTKLKGESSMCLPRTRKRGSRLPLNVQKFKNGYYGMFVSCKKFSKTIVREIHNDLFVHKLGYGRMKRNEYRDISKYFINYYPKRDEILKTLQENKELIKEKYLKDFPKLK